jgi:hypothetical protein
LINHAKKLILWPAVQSEQQHRRRPRKQSGAAD